ncbi:MAG: glycogen/starch/alpha-glucan phosphorylase [Planctomycetota bacterium]|nr:glycogen/starch/alpha-glucan phosphorylase [Planctomycetota bacterium]
MEAGAIAQDTKRHLAYTLGRDRFAQNHHYQYNALVLALRDRLMERWKATNQAYARSDCRRAYYISLEFLMGRALRNAQLNLGIDDQVREAMEGLGLAWEDLAETEADAGLGNGGLGRLAACFIDSCATLQLPVTGYGIRYEYGMFRQAIRNGYQNEEPDHWLEEGCPWELLRAEFAQRVHFGGHTEFYRTEQGTLAVRWVDTHDVLAIPHDVPIPGFENGTVNTLRLWKATATAEFDLQEFNEGDYAGAVTAKNSAENISMVLYPNDSSENGKELRLRQQYFLASASLKDTLRRWVQAHGDSFDEFADKTVYQLNDTHPTIAVAELMRLLMDEHFLGWDQAWDIVTKCMAYTNHTLLPEALEKWSVGLMQSLVPRVMEIIFEINARFMRVVANKWPGDAERQARLSIIEDGPHPQVRMAHLAVVASFSVNGVAQLHTELLQKGLFSEFFELWPNKFNNKTNGVTQRRWLAACNPNLRELINQNIGRGWITDLKQLEQLKPLADDSSFRDHWSAIKRDNKHALADLVERECGVRFPLDAIFDVQVKRIHEYKRQLLNVLHLIHLYDRIKRGDTKGWTPRCSIIGGKAAPGYAMAKRIIKLSASVADVINKDPDVGDQLKAVFLPNYRVSSMEVIAPATELSEQISTAGKEASGTGNMKFMMNGALTIGTLDGANIEIREEAGADNFFLFGLTAEQVEAQHGQHDPLAAIAGDEDLQRVMHLLKSGHFNHCEPGIYDDIVSSLTEWGDYWMVIADFRSYLNAQEAVAKAYQDQTWWTRASIINTATSGKFSTDRTMEEYNRGIWKLDKVPSGF